MGNGIEWVTKYYIEKNYPAIGLVKNVSRAE